MDKTSKTNETNGERGVVLPHGGYKKLASYQSATIVYDGTVVFTKRWMRSYKLREQMDGAARSGKQNIVEASADAGVSRKIELKLLGVSRGSLEELIEDLNDFLRQRSLTLWDKDDQRALAVRKLAYAENRSCETYKTYFENKNPEIAANALICLAKQTTYLLDRQIRALEEKFLEEGGFTENLYRERVARRSGK